MATLEQMQQLLIAVQQQGLEAIRVITAQQHTAMQEVVQGMQQRTRQGDGGMTDTRGVGRPINFRGDDSRFAEWIAKLQAYVRVTHLEAGNWMQWADGQDKPIDDDVIEVEFVHSVALELKLFSHRLFATIIS